MDITMKNINVTMDTGLADILSGWIRMNIEYESDPERIAGLLNIADQIDQKLMTINNL